MRILLIAGSRQLRLLLDGVLPPFDLTAKVVTLQTALNSRDRPPVLLHAERWDDAALAAVRRLTAIKATVYVISPDAADYRTYLAMLQRGARDAAVDYAPALEALAFKVCRDAGGEGSSRWHLGSRVFLPAEACLYQDGGRIELAPTEVRMLQRLCLAAGRDPAIRLTATQLAQELSAPESSRASCESSVRNYITRLRRKLEDDPERPQVLLRDANGYWVVLAPPPAAGRTHRPNA
jgi:DNA-binding response OmpR family regulator